MGLDEFLKMVCERPLPDSQLSRARLLAREMAEGALNGIWSTILGINFTSNNKPYIKDGRLEEYLEKRWNFKHPNFLVLEAMGYLKENIITSKAFALLDKLEPAPIFISYKRTESSAFALLIEYRLSQAGMLPFLDKQIQAGDPWHGELEDRIKDSDYFIIILGQETLKSEVTIREIQWALEAEIDIIPIWHNLFEFDPGKWKDIPDNVRNALSTRHTIRVLEENPLTYENALQELLKRFGISML